MIKSTDMEKNPTTVEHGGAGETISGGVPFWKSYTFEEDVR